MHIGFFGRHPLRNQVPPLTDLAGVGSVMVRGADANKDDDEGDDEDEP